MDIFVDVDSCNWSRPVISAIFDTYQYQTEGEGVESWLREVEELLGEPAAEGDADALAAQTEQSDVSTSTIPLKIYKEERPHYGML